MAKKASDCNRILLFSREGIWCSTVLTSQEEETGALLFSRRRKLVHYCSQEKETGALLFLGERNWCYTDLRRKKLVHLCSQEQESGALLFSRRRAIGLYCKSCCIKFTS